ncbi:FHA domain-containing protein [Pseudoalteromonas sp.]|uniref:FHA domain-containing protein n=1 Tax=Pseudoalteromonas sp. TaxID=53249 RepID=UPI003565F17E
MPARITVCYTDQPAVESFLYEGSGYLIGRSQECELRLEHPTVSRLHAKVAHQDKLWQVNDQRSLNGTKVNGMAITHSALADDAIISIGTLDCLFETKSAQQIEAISSHNDWRIASSQAQPSVPLTKHLQQNLSTQLQNIIMLTGTQRGIVLLGDSLASLNVCTAHGMQPKDFKLTHFEGSIGAITRCFESAQTVVAMDVSQHDLLKARKSIELKQISSLACIPLLSEDKVVGVVYTDSKMSDKVLTELDIEILTSMSRQIETTVQALLLQQSIDSLQQILNDKPISNGKEYSLLHLCH